MALLVTKREIKISSPGQDGEHQGAVAPSNQDLPGGLDWPSWETTQTSGRHTSPHKLVESRSTLSLLFLDSFSFSFLSLLSLSRHSYS